MDVSDDASGQQRTGRRPQQRHPRPQTEGRARNMRANRRADTKPELALRSALHRLGFRYRKDFPLSLDAGFRVRPDIVFTARKIAVFVDGCFWHNCPAHGRNPTVNEWYWSPKLRRNAERDTQVNAALRQAGWRVIRIWEHVPVEEAVGTVADAIEHAFDATRLRRNCKRNSPR